MENYLLSVAIKNVPSYVEARQIEKHLKDFFYSKGCKLLNIKCVNKN